MTTNRSTKLIAVSLFVSGCAMAAVPGYPQDEMVFPLEEAPAEAIRIAQEAAPNVAFSSVDVEIENGVVTLEFVGQTPEGKTVEVDVAQGWNVLEVEDLISLEDVPAPVLEALEYQMGDWTPSSVERSKRGDTYTYEFEGVNAEGRSIDIEVEANGESIIVLNDDET